MKMHNEGTKGLFTAEKNMTNTLTLVPVGMDVGFDDRLEVLLY